MFRKFFLSNEGIYRTYIDEIHPMNFRSDIVFVTGSRAVYVVDFLEHKPIRVMGVKSKCVTSLVVMNLFEVYYLVKRHNSNFYYYKELLSDMRYQEESPKAIKRVEEVLHEVFKGTKCQLI